MVWDGENVSKLLELLNRGLSASQIAKEIGNGVTRNAVIGKIHRYKMKAAASGGWEPVDQIGVSDSSANSLNSTGNVNAAANEPGTGSSPGFSSTAASKVNATRQASNDNVASGKKTSSSVKQKDITALAVEDKNDKVVSANADSVDCSGNIDDDIFLPEQDLDNVEKVAVSPQSVTDDSSEIMSKLAAKALRISVLELTEKTCRWPLGDPDAEDFCFCGLPNIPGRSYCPGHQAVANYHPSRRDRSGSRSSAVVAAENSQTTSGSNDNKSNS